MSNTLLIAVDMDRLVCGRLYENCVSTDMKFKIQKAVFEE